MMWELNEFAMMWELRELFLIHFIVFKQTACHLSYEANVEQVFSRAGNLSDSNMDPEYLAHLAMVKINKKSYGESSTVWCSQGTCRCRPLHLLRGLGCV